MIDERPLGIVIMVVGVVGTFLAVFADPLGIGEGHVFGWLQITGTILGGLVILCGLAMAMEWIPYPARRPSADPTSTSETTAVSGSSTPDQSP
jgi:hypothetical protein